MQNIYEVKNQFSINTNNDFDQNSMLQPEKTNLIHDTSKIIVHQKLKADVDLKDVIGNIWADAIRPVSYTHHKKGSDLPDNSVVLETQTNLDKLNNVTTARNGNVIFKSPRNKSPNPLSHLRNGSKTLPKKTKYSCERTSLNKDRGVFVSTKSIDISPSKYLFFFIFVTLKSFLY